jgi:hypothetical protein
VPQRPCALTVVLTRGDGEVTRWATPVLDQACDLAVVDGLARLHLVARRLGYTIRVEDPCTHLRALLDLCGLTDQLGES